MRIYYFGELIADTNKNQKNNERREASSNTEQRPIQRRALIDIVTNRPSTEIEPQQHFTVRRHIYA